MLTLFKTLVYDWLLVLVAGNPTMILTSVVQRLSLQFSAHTMDELDPGSILGVINLEMNFFLVGRSQGVSCSVPRVLSSKYLIVVFIVQNIP